MSDVSSTTSTPTGVTGAGGGNMIRITGMASGLDVDGVVKKMMAADQAKLDKAKQDQQTMQWKQQAYQDVIKEIKDLQSSFYDSISPDKNILSSTNFTPFTISGVGSSTVDTSVATFTPGVGTKTGKYSVSFGADGQLASVATKTGNNIVLDTSSGFTQDNWDAGAGSAKTIGFSINGTADQVITLNAAHASLADTVNDINTKISANASLKGTVQAVINGGNIQFQALSDSSVKISSTNTTVASDLDNLQGRVINPSKNTSMSDLGVSSDSHLLFRYNGSATDTDITIKSTDSISDIITNISNATSGAVKASYSQLTGKLSIQTSNTGSSQSIQITGIGVAATALGLSTDAAANNGTDAIVYITPPGGVSTKVIKPTNNFTIDGMTYSLSGKGDISVNVGTDSQKVYDKINSFITQYNKIVDDIQTRLTDKKDASYKPLTDAQKSSMSSSEITAWETKAKVGILRKDDNLQNLLNSLRSAFTSGVSNSGLSLGSYGSNTFGMDTSSDYSKPGHIEIVDPVKLKTTIANNSDQILKMFTNVSTTVDNSTYNSNNKKYQEDGIFTRIKGILESNVGYTNTTLNSAILTSYANKQYDYSTTGTSSKNTIPDQIYEQQLMIKKITDSMSTKQENYYQQFSKLETAMNQLNAQQSQLTSMLGG